MMADEFCVFAVSCLDLTMDSELRGMTKCLLFQSIGRCSRKVTVVKRAKMAHSGL